MVPTIEAAGLHEKRRGDRTAINFPESAPRRATRPPSKPWGRASTRAPANHEDHRQIPEPTSRRAPVEP